MAKTNVNDQNVDPEAEARRQALQDRLAQLNPVGGNTSSLDAGAMNNGDYLADPGLPKTYGATENAPTFDLGAIQRQGASLAAQADAENARQASIRNALGRQGAYFDPSGNAGPGPSGSGMLGDPEQVRQGAGLTPLGEVGLLGKIPGVGKLGELGGSLVDALTSRLGVRGASAAENAAAWGERGANEVSSGVRGPADATASGKGFNLVGDATDTSLPGWQQAARARGAFAGASEAAGEAASADAASTAGKSGGLADALRAKLAGIPKPVVAGTGVIAGAGALGALSQGTPQAATDTSLPDQQAPSTPVTDAYFANGGNKPIVQPTTQPVVAGPTTGPTTGVVTPPRVTGTTTTTTPTAPPKPPVIPIIPPKPPVGGGGTTTGPVGGTGGTTGGTGTGSTTGGPLPGQGFDLTTSAGLSGQINSDLGDISKILAAGPKSPDVQSIFAVQGKTILDMIDKQIADLQSSGAQVDPATQNTLQTLRDELDRQLKVALEDLNRRGVAESGIRAEVETMLRKGNMSDQAKILAERLSRIQTSIDSLRGQKTQAASQFALAGAQGQTQADAAERARMDQLRGQLIAGRSALLNNQTSVEQAQASRDFTAEQNDLQRQYAMAEKQAEIASTAANNEAQRAWEQKKIDIQNQFNQSLQDQRIAAGQYQSSGDAASGAAATQHVIDQSLSAGSLEEALAALNAQQAELEASGVNVAKAKAGIEAAWGQ